MALFFILLVSLAIFQISVRKDIGRIYPQVEKKQISRMTNVPFCFSTWTLICAFCTYSLSSLTSLIGELFDVDNYIGLFNGGWLGLILNYLRANGFIGDIQEPLILIQYREIISLFYTTTWISCVISGIILIVFYQELKKKPLNCTAILSCNYLSMACALTSFLLLIWGVYGFENMLNCAIKFSMDELYLFFILIFIVSCGVSLYCGIRDTKKLFAIVPCKTITWQQVLAIKKDTDKGEQHITENQLVGIAIVLSLCVSGFVIYYTFPVNELPEPQQHESTYTEEIVTQNDFVNEKVEQQIQLENEQNCIAILEKYYTASYAKIEEWGGLETFETERFIKYTSCWDYDVLTNNQMFGIGENNMKVESIESNPNLANSYIVTISYDGYEPVPPICVVMAKDEDTWKIDNITSPPYTEAIIDYSRPASDYYVYPECDETEKDSENFISL